MGVGSVEGLHQFFLTVGPWKKHGKPHLFFSFPTSRWPSCGRPPFGVVVLHNCLSPPRLSLKSTGHMLLLPCPWWIHCQSKTSGVGWRWSRSQLSGHLRSRSCRIFWSVTFMPMWLLSYGEVTGTCCVNQDQTESMARWWPVFGRLKHFANHGRSGCTFLFGNSTRTWKEISLKGW